MRFFSAGPLSVFAIILIIGVIIILIPLLILGVIGAAFTRLGFSWIAALAVVLLMLSGSFVNIPVYRLRRDTIRLDPTSYPARAADTSWSGKDIWETVIAVNFGGAVIPLCVSLFLLFRAFPLYGPSLLAFVCISLVTVALITAAATRRVTGAVLPVPFFIPALAALLTGLLLTGGTGLSAAVTAFAGGTAGTLLGGTISHLSMIKERDAAGVSIGGAGTFDAVFLCCLLPALIA
jgi:uncharacterized membrane protein